MRQRNAVLQTLECMRRRHPGATLVHLIAFLYICENEGLNLAELADVCGFTRASASRVAALLGPHEAGSEAWGLGLIRAERSPVDRHSKLLYLTEAGREFADRIDELILARRTIGCAQSRAA